MATYFLSPVPLKEWESGSKMAVRNGHRTLGNQQPAAHGPCPSPEMAVSGRTAFDCVSRKAAGNTAMVHETSEERRCAIGFPGFLLVAAVILLAALVVEPYLERTLLAPPVPTRSLQTFWWKKLLPVPRDINPTAKPYTFAAAHVFQ
jgi:hypothetical protein